MSKPSALSMSVTDWVLLLALSLLWGGSFFFAQIAVAEVPPLTLAVLRVGFAALLLAVAVRAAGQRVPFARLWPSFAIMGLTNNAIPFTLFFWSQTQIPSGLASILNATTPLFTVLVAHLATHDDKLTPARLVGLIAGFGGVVTMIGPDLLKELGINVAAQLACLLAAFSYAIGGVYGRRFRYESPLLVATGQLTASTLVLLPLAIVIDRPWLIPTPSASASVAVILLAALSTALAYLIFFRILARAGATNVMLVTFLIPITAILLGTFVLGESLEPQHFAGMAAIAIGLAAIDGRPARYLARAVRGW
jgi:drug/metabolite transporter (DMT)-like permease